MSSESEPKLSRKQTAILSHCAAGRTTAEIARQLNTTRSSVRRHKTTICRKLDVNRIRAAVARTSGG